MAPETRQQPHFSPVSAEGRGVRTLSLLTPNPKLKTLPKKSQDSIVSLSLSQGGSNAASTLRKRGRNSPGSNSDPQVTTTKKRHIASSPVASLGRSTCPPPAEASPPVPGPSPPLGLASTVIPPVISSGDAEGEEESSSAPHTPDNTIHPPPAVSQCPLVVDSGEETKFEDSDKHNF